MEEDKRCHLQMIQSIITRMATNSFLIKGWSITLVSALFALAADRADDSFVFVAYFPCIIFWLLDGYFLWQESLYRDLYDEVRMISSQLIDYSMNTAKYQSNRSLFKKTFSETLFLFHGVVLASIFFVMKKNDFLKFFHCS